MNISRSSILLFCVLTSCGICVGGPVRLPEARLTILTVDEDNQPLANMPVHVWLSESAIRDGQTDTNGLFVAEGTCTIKDVPISIVKEGFYYSGISYQFPNYLSIKDNRWQPWNPVVTTMVRRIVNPIPMYAKNVCSVVSVLDQSVGYDLMKGDWIAPYGVGEVADILISMKKRYIDIRNFDSSLDIVVANTVDGLQETSLASFQTSQFRLFRYAPLDGYVITDLHVSDSSTNYFKPNENQSYYFRIRTVTNESGQTTSALYGKIRSYIGFDVRREKTGTVNFTYYLNPAPNDRNLEFDPKRNLFTNLGEFEKVSEP